MVKPPHLHQDEEEDDDDYEDLNKAETTKVEGKGSEQKANTHRSKHSETEQRRRSKINERFQTLRDLIPQNDQKRDKASFLLEVIEYIQFLQEKLQTYEGYQSWNQEPAKLIPWKNHHAPAENFPDPSPVIKNGSGCENNVLSPAMLTNVSSSIESDMGTAAVYKALDHTPGFASSMAPLSMQVESNAFATHGRGNTPTQSFYEPPSDAENFAYRPLSSWQGKEYQTEGAIPSNTQNQDLTSKGETAGLSSAYSQGVLNSLAQALRSSGVDLSQASISVEIDVGKRVNGSLTTMTPSPKDKETQYPNHVMSQAAHQSFGEDSDPANKRRKTGKT